VRIVRTVRCPIDVFRELLGELLARGESATFRVEGKSMHPTIVSGDVITVRGVDPADLYVGDIVAFRQRDSLIVHRIIDLQRPSDGPLLFRTAGDGNSWDDGAQADDVLIGRVVLVRGRRGEWNPNQPFRRLSGRFRVTLARRPRLRAAFRAVKTGCRLLGLLPKKGVVA
jgi:hypothetical protein